MPEANLDVAGCGSMVVDLFYRTPRIINADEKIILSPHLGTQVTERAMAGGLMLNQMGWARALGLETGVFGKLGDDRHGKFLREAMDRLGIQHRLTLDGSASAFAAVFVDAKGNRAIYMSRGATGELTPAEIRDRHGAFIRRAHLVSTEISQVPLRTVVAILRFARTNSIPSVLDLDVPPSDAIASLGTRADLERALKLATFLKPAKASARELAGISGRDPLRIAQAIRKRYGNRAVIITDGESGCAISAEDTALKLPAFRARQIDSTGAGDAFLGGVIAGLRWGLPWDAAGRLGNAAGAVCVGELGAFPAGFEVRNQIEKLYGSKLPFSPPSANSGAAEVAAASSSPEIQRFFEVSLRELADLKNSLDLDEIGKAVAIIRAAESSGGRVHLTGVGKPEHVARYAASLFCSVGTPATFLHATETLHGSLGQVHPRDVVMAISNSGNTDEICAAAEAIRERGAKLIAVTGDSNSKLARAADLVLRSPVKQEGGGLGLAPRISVLAEILVLAGLSVALELANGLTAEDYSRWHRSGALGDAARKLARKSSGD